MTAPSFEQITDRSRRLWGSDAFSKLQNARVCVFGLGGVGSFAVSSLARGGVCNLMLIDGDSVDPSNINRQAFAFTSTVSKRKTDIAKCFVHEVSPECNVETLDTFITTDKFTSVLEKVEEFRPDVVVDAIDSVSIKLLLAKTFAGQEDILFVSSMGAANKTDASKITLSCLSKTMNDPLARIIRKEARRQHIPDYEVCYSSEKHSIAPDSQITRTVDKKILGSTSFIPAIMGHMLAGYVMNYVAT